jgi:protein-L-isoaspartate(D-aspartate) O-methyltransferase
MRSAAELAAVRAAYAEKILAVAGVAVPRLQAAFADVRREDFVGQGPWPVFRGPQTYVPTPDTDPAHLYDDILIGLIPERQINNGQPSYHAYLLAHAAPAAGEHAVHVGAGTGYYTAIMAHMVGASGRVTAIEFDDELATRAKKNLATLTNVEVVHGDGARVRFDHAEVIYVNAGATRPADTWLDRLADGGRLLLPLTTDKGFTLPRSAGEAAVQGAVFLIERQGGEFRAKWISPVAIFPCAGTRDETSERALARALEGGRWQEVTRLYRRDDIPEERRWLHAPGWCLAYS